MTTPHDPNAHSAPPNDRSTEPVDAESPFDRYACAVEAGENKREALRAELAANAGLMRVLYMAYLDLGRSAIDERNDPDDIHEASVRGWIAGHRRVLTRRGLEAWWQWKEQVTPHNREVGFQRLWRDVIAW